MKSCLIPLTIMSLLLGCNNTSFQGGGKKEPPKPTPQRPATEKVEEPVVSTTIDGKKSIIETISVDAKVKSNIDIVWLIDNSGSMTEEASQVRDNLEGFITTLNEQNNVKLALLSSNTKDRPSTGVSLSDEAKTKGHRQFEGKKSGSTGGVNSNDALLIAAAAICPISENSFDAGTRKICGQPLTRSMFTFGQAFSGNLTDFFRADAKTVFVFVTDDDALYVDQSNFLTMIDGKIPDKKPLVYGFIGTGESKCSIARRGTAYEALAKQCGGETFDICNTDWKEHFEKLTAAVQESIVSDFILKTKSIVSIDAVELNGKVLTSDQFSWDGKLLSIKEGVLSDNQQTLSVTLTAE